MSLLLKILAILFSIFTLVGLYKPWVVFWWSDFSNRKKVLKYYGVLALAFWVLYGVAHSAWRMAHS